MQEIVLEMKDITKTFYGVQALKKANLILKRGQIHALLGENGAGKSTLMNILIGSIKPTSGDIIYFNEKIENYTTQKALAMGIAMIHQEMNCSLKRSIMEN
ncbi:MAG: ATP-binding cassette domain-containing protein, partial [Bacilli bacterium]